MTLLARLAVPFCGLPCPEMTLSLETGRVRSVDGGCPECRAAAGAPRLEGPPRVEGRPVSLAEAIDQAARHLGAGRSPFLFGLAHSAVGTARAAALLAGRLRGAIDIEGSEALQPEIEALRAAGGMSATFGALRASADVVLLWRADPRAAHPDLLPPVAGAARRRFILVPAAAAAGAAPPGSSKSADPERPADLVLPVPPGGDLEALLVLRGLVAGRPVLSAGRDERPALHAAADALRAARYAAILWPVDLTRGLEGRAIAAALTALAATLATRTRAACRSLGAGGNVAGAIAGLLAATGHPRAVGFHAGAPRAAWDEFGAGRMIEAGGADALLLIGPRRAPARRMAPLVLVGPQLPEGLGEPEVVIPTASPALSGRGLWLSADGLPVTLTAPIASALPDEGEVLEAIAARLGAGT